MFYIDFFFYFLKILLRSIFRFSGVSPFMVCLCSVVRFVCFLVFLTLLACLHQKQSYCPIYLLPWNNCRKGLNWYRISISRTKYKTIVTIYKKNAVTIVLPLALDIISTILMFPWLICTHVLQHESRGVKRKKEKKNIRFRTLFSFVLFILKIIDMYSSIFRNHCIRQKIRIITLSN